MRQDGFFSFVIGTVLYQNGGNYYVFSRYTTSVSAATKFKTLNNSSAKGTFTLYDLPTSASSGRTYTVAEYSVPDADRYEKLSKTVTLPSPTSDFAANAGTKTVKMNNNETTFDAKVGTAELEKDRQKRRRKSPVLG